MARQHAHNANAPQYADMWGVVQLHTLLFGAVYAAMLALPFTRWRVSLQNLLASNAAATFHASWLSYSMTATSSYVITMLCWTMLGDRRPFSCCRRLSGVW